MTVLEDTAHRSELRSPVEGNDGADRVRHRGSEPNRRSRRLRPAIIAESCRRGASR